MIDYKNEKYKRELKENIAKLLLQYRDTHDIHFITITFEPHSKQGQKYRQMETLKALYADFNQYSINCANLHPELKCKMILFPEASKESSSKKHERLDHFHGYLLIHKDNRERFRRRLIGHIKERIATKLQIKETVLRFKTSFYERLGSRGYGQSRHFCRATNRIDFNKMNSKYKNGIRVHSIDLCFLEQPVDIQKSGTYMMKKYSPQCEKFDFDEAIASQKGQVVKTSIESTPSSINYDDVYIFGEIKPAPSPIPLH